MTKRDLQKLNIELRYRFAFYSTGLLVAFILALVGSQYAGEAFALIGGFMGGDALNQKIKA